VTTRQLWLRLTVSWGLAAALLIVARPSAPAAAWSPVDAATLGLGVGTALACALAGLKPALSPGAVATLALSAAAEEVVWRWFALGSLSELAGPVVALAATSLAFGAVHPRGRRQHAATGFAFGAVYLATGSLAGAWCAHCSYNLFVATAARRAPPEPA
jgi:membrane protease YdiL (CAAX protease family)